MAKKGRPLPVPIPPDLADAIDTHPSNISHWNKGDRPIPFPKAIRIMEIAETDERLTGLCLIHLRPEQKLVKPAWLTMPCKKKGRGR